MAQQPSGQQYEYFEDELVGVLENALRQENNARDFYIASAGKRAWRPKTIDMFNWLAGEESKHAQLISERLNEVKKRLSVIQRLNEVNKRLADIHYKPGSKEE